MKKIVYYVAISLDGYIAGLNEDISNFIASGKGVHQYLTDLMEFKTVIMGRNTYEFGYKFGLSPGQPAYSHMQHYIFSKSLKFKSQSDQVNIYNYDLDLIKELKHNSKTDIYLCGGSIFAGWLLENEMIDVLKIKINPVVLGNGIPMFSNSKKPFHLKLKTSKSYSDGLTINSYDILY